MKGVFKKHKPLFLVFLFLVSLLIINGCATSKKSGPKATRPDSTHETTGQTQANIPEVTEPPVISQPQEPEATGPTDMEVIENKLREVAREWHATPHCMGGYSRRCIDCSGFTKKMFEDIFGVMGLPRTVKGLATMNRGFTVGKHQLRAGDLVAFKQTPPWYPYHIGIFIKDGEFMHASKKYGVMVSNVNDPKHWGKYFWTGRRIITDDQIKVYADSFRNGTKPIATKPRTPKPAKKRVTTTGFTDMGKASYYGSKFNGKKTASGERYSDHKLTAAHKTLPFGTLVRVTNLKNNKTTIVRVNDRGPFTPGRIIDLSRSAAKMINMIRYGVVDVKIEVVK